MSWIGDRGPAITALRNPGSSGDRWHWSRRPSGCSPAGGPCDRGGGAPPRRRCARAPANRSVAACATRFGRSTIDRLESLVSIPPVGTKVVVLTAEGPDFSAGYDLREAAHGNAERLIANGLNFALLKKSRVPVIAALHGNVIGGGLELALAADVRLATPNTKLGLPAGRLGLVYSEEGVRLLVDSVGESRSSVDAASRQHLVLCRSEVVRNRFRGCRT